MSEFSVNFEAALTFLKLAVEQIRAIDVPTADFINTHYQTPLNQAFERYLKHVDTTSLNVFAKSTSLKLAQLGQELLERELRNRPHLPPPGLGFGILRDSPLLNPVNVRAENRSVNFNKPFYSQKTSPFGTIGDKRSPQDSRKSSSSDQQGENGVPIPSRSFWLSPTPSPKEEMPGLSYELFPPHDQVEPLQNLAAPRPSTSWAKIAALPGEVPLATMDVSSKANTGIETPTKAVPRLVTRRIPRESDEEQKRVIWVVHLPERTSLRDIGSRINVGPVMSILMQRDIGESYPGLSACVIFQHAEKALASLNSRKLCWAKGINAFLGSGFPADEDVVSMEFPSMARRRLKWSHAQLFHKVSLKEFKQDIFEICGVQNVELVHFYNPGEVTIIFASVAVATFVLKKFRSMASTVSHKYRGVEVAYARDFNERPPTEIKSSYGTDNMVRRVPTDGALQGIYSGPPVDGK